eukprot:9880493-Karenia_brevis.AAC.1
MPDEETAMPHKSWRVDGDLNQVAGKDLQINQEIMHLQSPDVVEIYSPPRVTQQAKLYTLKPGWSLDLTTVDENGEPWDFNKIHMKNKAIRKIIQDEPMLVIGSPMCTNFSQLMNINWSRMSQEDVQKRWEEAVMHIEFCAFIYKLQAEHGRYFLHEHPLGATSWQLPAIQE